jgi:N-acetylneuraminic acid mutarotase
MTELKERFSLIDEIGTRDLWGEVRRRAAAPEAPPRAVDWPPALGRRLAAAAVAIAVFATAVVFAWGLSHPDPGFAPRPPLAVDLASELPEGWSELPAPPEVRSEAATVWTGSELLVWGGYEFTGSGDEDPAGDGFVFHGATRTWGVLPHSPLAGRSDAASAWTGEELLIWGGFDGGFRDVPYFDDGAAFDPVTGTWRMLPAPPIGPRTPFSVWTGRELIVWGSVDRFARLRDGAAYDPTTNSWRTIADGPTDITDGSAVWTGEEMIVFGVALDGNNHSDTPTAIGSAYDPVANTWRELPSSQLSPQAHTAEWVNGELIAWDYEHRTAAYDPGTDVWRALPKVPLSFAECRPESVATSHLVFGNYCGQTVVYSSQEDGWHREPIPGVVDEGCCRVLEPVAAGNVVLVPSHSYGMGLGEPDRRMFVYNPPAGVRTDPRGEVLEPEPFIPQGAERDGDQIRLPVIFPDGSQATLVYPIPLDLATLGFQPDVSYIWLADPPPRYPIVFLHDRNASIAEYVEGTEPVGSVNSYRNIEIWNMSETWLEHRAQLRGGWLRIALRSWTVLIALKEVADADRVAANLDVRETTTGFPVGDATGPIQLAEGFGESEGATLSLGDGTAEPDTVSQLDATIFLSPDGCTRATNSNWSEGYGSACLGDRNVFASIYGDRDFVTAVIEGLRVEDFRQA